MKIAIGTNIFGNDHRQDICIQSLERLKKEFNEVELYNLQFEDGKDLTEHNSFITLKCLKTKSGDLVQDAKNKNLPTMHELFDGLANVEADYFIYTNNDLIISNRLIKMILEEQKNCYPCSRLAIENINSLDDKIIPSHYQVAGFDVFGVKTEWWKEHKDKFPHYLIGFPAWDVHYATVMMIYDNDCTLINKWPPCTFHIIHESPWKDSSKIPERVWNENIFWNEHKDGICKIWNTYLHSILLRRPNNYWDPFENEKELERQYFRNGK